MKTTKGGKVMNPTDAYRKELRRKELKRNKKERKKVREVGILKKDPESIKEQIEKLEMMKADGALDKARKHKKRQLEDTLSMVLKKRKEYEDKMREKGETPVMFSHLGPLRKRSNTKEDESETQPKPEDSVYYHPTLNPTGAPPPGKPPMFKSSIGPRISTPGPSSANSEAEEVTLSAPPLPPPPLPDFGKLPTGDDLDVSSMPLPPLPPPPPKPAISSGLVPPPPPGPPPKGAATANAALAMPPPPQPLQRLSQPPPPGSGGHVDSDNKASESANIKVVKVVLPPPPPPPPPSSPGLQSKILSDASPPVANTNSLLGKNEINAKLIPLMPPPPPQGIPLPNLRPDMIPHGMLRFPSPPPPPPPPPHDIRLPFLIQGLPNRPSPPPPPGMAAPMPRPLFAVLPGRLSLLRPPMPPGHSVNQEDVYSSLRPPLPQRPSYVKSAASTVIKRPLAQHTPELTAMVPASVRVRRETALPKAKSKPLLAAAPNPSQAAPIASISKPATSSAAAAPKAQTIDDSYVAFLEDMKALGAVDG